MVSSPVGLSSPRPASPRPPQPDELELSGSPVTGAPLVGSPSVVSPLVNLKHGSDRTSGIVKPKQEFQKKEEEDYEYLTRNVFPGNIRPENLGTGNDEEAAGVWCKCLPVDEGEEGCLEDCENRARRVECRQEYCRAGEGCQNMAVTNGLGERVTTNQGRLVAMEAVPAGTFLAQFTGEVLAKEELENRMANLYQMGQPLYLLPLAQTAVVDATKKGSIARLGVHSCNPSAEVKPWLVEIGGVEQQVLAMYSLKPLAAGDPITYDFSPQLDLLKTSKPCTCGATNCRRILGSCVRTIGPRQCTACQAPILQAGAEGTVALHPQLATPVCSPCRSKAVELEVVEGEAVCRWCSNHGVDGLSCSKCDALFCRKCLNVNLGAGFIKLASASEGDWTCLLCKSAPLEKLRANLLAPLQQGKAKVAQRSIRPRTPRPQGMAGLRPASPRMMPVRAPPRPGTPALSRGRLPSPGYPSPRLVGPGVSIQRVPAPPQRPIASPFETTKLQLSQKYAGLGIVIVPAKEQTGQVEAAIREVEAAGKMLLDAAGVAGRNLKNGQSVSEVKEVLGRSVQDAKAKLSIASQKL